MRDISEGPRSVAYLPLEWRLQNHPNRSGRRRILLGLLLLLMAALVASHWLVGLF